METIARLREIHDLKDHIDKLIYAKSDLIDRDGLNGLEMWISHERSVIELLEFIMDDDGAKNIEQFIYELDYGRTCKSGTAMNLYGNNIDFSSAETLYDCLMREKNKREQTGGEKVC